MNLFRILFLLTAIGAANLLSAQTSDRPEPGDSVKGTEATALLRQIEVDRRQLIESRRLALIEANKARSEEARLKVLQKHGADQRERRRKIAEDEAKVRDALKQERAARRAQVTR